MCTRWQLHRDDVSHRYIPAFYDNRHNASLANELALRIATEHCRGQTFCKCVNLSARVAQASDFNHRLIADLQYCAGWQSQQVRALSRSHLCRPGELEIHWCVVHRTVLHVSDGPASDSARLDSY
jgi:hypothetical protein